MPSGQAAVVGVPRTPPAAQEEVRGVRLGHEPALVQHDRVVGASQIRLDLGHDRGQQVVVMNLRVQGVRAGPPDAGGDQRDPARVVHRRLVLRQHDERGPGLVKPGVHPAGDLDSAGQGEPDMHVVGHLVGGQSPADFLRDLRVCRDLLEGQRQGRPAQPGQMLSEPEDPAPVQAQTLPDGVTALHDRVERTDRGLVPMREPAANADDQVPVALIKGLQHGALLGLPDDSAIRGTAVSSAPPADLASTENIGGRPRSHGRVGRQSLRTAGPELFTDGNTAG